MALAQMWNLLAGYAGLVSVGQQAFVGIGAYSLWVFSEKFGINPFLCVPIAGVVAALLAVPTAGLAFRLRGGYFAVGTWVIAEVYRLLVTQITWLGGGSGVSINSAGDVDRGTREAVIFWLALWEWPWAPSPSSTCCCARGAVWRSPPSATTRPAPGAGRQHLPVQALGLHHRRVRARASPAPSSTSTCCASSPRRPSASSGARS